MPARRHLLEHATSVRVIRGIWPYKNPARIVAQAVGIPNAETALTPYGGNYVQSTVNRSALDIQAQRHDVIVITGAECGYTQARARKQGVRSEMAGRAGHTGPVDRRRQKHAPRRRKSGRPRRTRFSCIRCSKTRCATRAARAFPNHLKRISELWSRFSDVASRNPHAWLRERHSAEEIRTPSATNRPVSFPYPKLMNSNNNVDQAAALILCSVAAARRFGIAEDRWIYPWAGTDAHDHYFVSNRDNLHSSPAIRLAGNRCLELAGVSAKAARSRRPLQLLPGSSGSGRRGTRPRRSKAADGHRRAHVRWRTAEQLRDAFDRADGRGAARGSQCNRSGHRKRRLSDETRVRRVFGATPNATPSATKTCRRRSMRRHNGTSRWPTAVT